ncbi:tripartite tricarboxylate transporter substrate binding protein [Corticibacter populi]|uniref:Tripartite tricarboxylate transporter substrate binding protein n=1 Tax=Corticibacter populi TaxID=1550736 RepID=A0A3M6QSE9_9BURK|nr:tripartite tricarboxylate transporter substrate binding protein [Corticibacter populi]RMX05913.1 tripartite tricarboxylate transporter substrate binding protein [Corticibacter populi]RZS30767.1 tripartite-type tricarboxylate transporter receptor subunit TctC [Corticibacter populi]
MPVFQPKGLGSRLAARFATAVVFCSASLAGAAGFPDNQPITIIVPYAPGGSSDAIARRLSQPLAEELNATVVVENKAGGNGAIGASQLARAKPDGHTLMIGALGVLAINEGLYENLGYLPRRDFDMLTIAVRTPNAFVVPQSSAIQTLPQFLEQLKAQQGGMPIATAGSGSSEHLTLALFLKNSGAEAIHVPYKGGGPAIADTLAGHVHGLVSNLGAVTPYIQSGRLRLITVTGDQRTALFPDVPVPQEAGVSGMEVYSWQGIAAPKGLPVEVKDKLAAALHKVLTTDAFRQQMTELGFDVVANDAQTATSFQIEEAERWKQVIREGNIQVD